MPDVIAVKDKLLKAEYRIPTITAYNRLEATPRTTNFDRSLKAEVRDALWMLTRQFQFGEFEGEDAASAVTSQIVGEHTTMDRLRFLKNGVSAYDQSVPLETHAERETLTANLFLAVQMGRYFVKLMRANALDGSLDKFIAKYTLTYTIDRNDIEGQLLLRASAGRVFDGFNLHRDILTPDGGGTAFETWLTSQGLAIAPFKPLTDAFVAWHARNYSQPINAADACWLPSQLEYQFAVSSPAVVGRPQDNLIADQYAEGHLDWYSFDLDQQQKIVLDPDPAPVAVTEQYASFIPAPIKFKGMPLPRFWMMEDSQTDFGKIDTSVTGLLHLLLAEFGLIYSNDWFMLPYPLTINTVCEIKNMVITDVFGQHILIRPAGRGSETSWHRWAMFHHTDRNDSTRNTNVFYLAPAITKALESDPLEDVNMLRDEMANMVWGVESTVPSQAGRGVSGMEMARPEVEPTPFVPVGDTAAIRYVLGTTVPENWIPFIPVHIPGSDTEIRLQRARLPGAKPPKGVLLNEAQPVYFINEEEVPRSGISVQRSYQRTRWLGGKTFLWIGRRKETGQGEGWSNLAFDQITDILPAAP
jgi:hypothetical protein